MSNKNTLRLYIDKELTENLKINLSFRDNHHLKNVLRAKKGIKVFLFNGKDGEWLGEVIEGRA